MSAIRGVRASELTSRIFGGSDKDVIRSVYSGLANESYARNTTNFTCDWQAQSPYCKGVLGYNTKSTIDSISSVVLCPGWLNLTRLSGCEAWEGHGVSGPEGAHFVMLHELSHSQYPGSKRVLDSTWTGGSERLIYNKTEIADAVALRKTPVAAGQRRNGGTDRIANAYCWFAAGVRARHAAECTVSSCGIKYSVLASTGEVTLRDVEPDGRGCGRGLLDNLRGQCGVVTGWQCRDEGRRAISTRFLIPLHADGKCVHDAIWLASGKEVDCPRQGATLQ